MCRIRVSRLLQVVLVGVMAAVMMGADGGEARFSKLGHLMVCQCGCGQILLECNHVGCPVSPVMIGELQTQLATGLPNTGVLNWFAAKYGAVVLAAPIRGGFDTVAWVAPIAVFLLGTVGTGWLVRTWVRRRGAMGLTTASAGSVDNPTDDKRAMQERIRREMES